MMPRVTLIVSLIILQFYGLVYVYKLGNISIHFIDIPNGMECGLHDIISLWNTLFDLIFVSKSIERITINLCQGNDRFIINQKIIIFAMEQTITMLNITTINSIKLSHHQRIALRRKIMLICSHFNIKNDNYWLQLHKTLGAYSHNSKNPNKFKNIHVPKTAGNTLCNTLRERFINLKTPSKYSYWCCNILPNDLSIHPTEYGSISCDHQYKLSKDFDFISSESVLHGNGISRTPKLCDDFIYIFSVRHPLERVISHFVEYNLLIDNADFAWYRAATDDVLNGYDMNQSIYVSLKEYQRITMAKQYREFFVNLMETESNGYIDDVHTLISHNNITLHSMNDIDANDYYYHYFSVNNKEWIVRFAKWRYTKLYMIRSIVSNMYCRWIGFNHSSLNITKDSLLISSDAITFDVYRNALNVLLEIDFVLPFSKWMESEYGMNERNDSMWFVLLNDYMRDRFTPKISEDVLFWFEDRDSETETELLSSIDVALWLTKNDLHVIKKFNIYDLALYQLAKQIERADIEYYLISKTA